MFSIFYGQQNVSSVIFEMYIFLKSLQNMLRKYILNLYFPKFEKCSYINIWKYFVYMFKKSNASCVLIMTSYKFKPYILYSPRNLLFNRGLLVSYSFINAHVFSSSVLQRILFLFIFRLMKQRWQNCPHLQPLMPANSVSGRTFIFLRFQCFPC